MFSRTNISIRISMVYKHLGKRKEDKINSITHEKNKTFHTYMLYIHAGDITKKDPRNNFNFNVKYYLGIKVSAISTIATPSYANM